MPAIGGIAGVATLIGTAASVAGTVISGVATAKQGKAEKEAAYYEAEQLDRAAGEEVAAAQREAFELDRQTRMLRGTGRAAAGAGGAGGVGVIALDAEVARLGRYRRNLVFYGGVERGKGLRAQANARRLAGRAALSGSRAAAFGTILGGIGAAAGNAASFYATFGRSQPTSPAAAPTVWSQVEQNFLAGIGAV